MFERENSDAQWRSKIADIEEACTDKLAELQKDLDSLKYSIANSSREIERLGFTITHVLDYFLNERKLHIPTKDLDLFYLKEIIDKYHIAKESQGNES